MRIYLSISVVQNCHPERAGTVTLSGAKGLSIGERFFAALRMTRLAQNGTVIKMSPWAERRVSVWERRFFAALRM